MAPTLQCAASIRYLALCGARCFTGGLWCWNFPPQPRWVPYLVSLPSPPGRSNSAVPLTCTSHSHANGIDTPRTFLHRTIIKAETRSVNLVALSLLNNSISVLQASISIAALIFITADLVQVAHFQGRDRDRRDTARRLFLNVHPTAVSQSAQSVPTSLPPSDFQR
jgi:hypothetical protein